MRAGWLLDGMAMGWMDGWMDFTVHGTGQGVLGEGWEAPLPHRLPPDPPPPLHRPQDRRSLPPRPWLRARWGSVASEQAALPPFTHVLFYYILCANMHA